MMDALIAGRVHGQPTLHAQVLALRRTHSARAVAQALSIPLRSARRPSSAERRFGKRCIQQNFRWEKFAHLKLATGNLRRRSKALRQKPPLCLASQSRP